MTKFKEHLSDMNEARVALKHILADVRKSHPRSGSTEPNVKRITDVLQKKKAIPLADFMSASNSAHDWGKPWVRALAELEIVSISRVGRKDMVHKFGTPPPGLDVPTKKQAAQAKIKREVNAYVKKHDLKSRSGFIPSFKPADNIDRMVGTMKGIIKEWQGHIAEMEKFKTRLK